MEDKEEEQPTCSKKNSPRDSAHDLRGKKGDKKDDGRRDDDRSEYTASNCSSHSRVDMAKTMSKAPLEKKDLKIAGHVEKRRMRNSGRVRKRSPPARRQPKRACKRRPKSRPEKKRRAPSVSTVFTRLSSVSSFGSVCKYCRRYYEMRRSKNRKIVKRRKLRRKRGHPLNFISAQNTASECLQAGSRSQMLSPLLVKEYDPPMDERKTKEYGEITPQMIYLALRDLMMWRHEVNINYIAEYLRNHYPVCQKPEALLEELGEKLRIAAVVGMVIETSLNHWSLSSSLYKRKLTKNHVTLFWKLYGDTMKPISKKAKPEPQVAEANDRETNINNMYL